MAHASFEGRKGGEMNRLLSVVPREGLNARAELGHALLGQEPQGTVTRGYELSMRLHTTYANRSNRA